MQEKLLTKFAETVLSVGVNLQKNQGLEIVCPVEKREIAEALTKKAYENKKHSCNSPVHHMRGSRKR